jgi:hypothetical protein
MPTDQTLEDTDDAPIEPWPLVFKHAPIEISFETPAPLGLLRRRVLRESAFPPVGPALIRASRGPLLVHGSERAARPQMPWPPACSASSRLIYEPS